MDSPDDVFPAENRCEVCGGELGDEIVIQEFADGSLARLCRECAAGAALDDRERPDHPQDRSRGFAWPKEPAETPAGGSAEFDPLEKTRELLMPVTDLIALQAEMQSALERLAASLERFATEMLTESQGRTDVETRLQTLERELDKTRARLQETEFILANTLETEPGILAGVIDSAPVTAPIIAPEVPEAPEGSAATAGEASGAETGQEPVPASLELPEDLWSRLEAKTDRPAPATESPATESFAVPESATRLPKEATSAEAPARPAAPLASEGTPSGKATPAAEVPITGEPPTVSEPAAEPAPTRREEPQGTGFRIDEVQAAQRYYNESPFTNRIREVQSSLGKPKASLTRVPGDEPRAIVTIAWDIVWYQYLVDLRRDLPSSHERVVLHREGMDLDELAYYFKEPNAVINDDGRLDASELEVRLLSDPSALITEMTPTEMQALEDATEEIWDQRVAPEFKWDD
ncbi:MAG: hypothetical protein LLG45_01885 [Actinomycetia bacterium]|nr:hypothetical protein [Actinomycetes bacterium]